MHFPTLGECQAEDGKILAQIFHLENEVELLARRQILGLVGWCETPGTVAFLDKLYDAFYIVDVNST